ncbi:unnamed protein product [Echinostoma caproni]|uniref:Uncharacterized protein n=1 Tax=Echinostoma caproni TaxID=27848 RepID=A0A3P8I7A8_9TREM|nr:unnamed protein product [Echinostoma caproni]
MTDDDEDDKEDNRDARSSPDLDSPGRKSDCFIFDPEAYPSTTSTATISCRRPLRPSSMTTIHDAAITATSTARGAVSAEVSQTDHATLDTSVRLPVPEPNEEVFELAVRMPDGHREVFRLASTLTLQNLRIHPPPMSASSGFVKTVMILLESTAGTGHRIVAFRPKVVTGRKEKVAFDPLVQREVLYRELRKIRSLRKAAP